MDSQTAAFYNRHAGDIAAVYQTAVGGIRRHVAQSFPPGCCVLDIGFGSGRDLKMLMDAGYDVHGVEPCARFIELAVEYFPSLQGRLTRDALPGLNSIANASYDGVLCSAVLMHLPKELLFDGACAIGRVLKPDGRLLISIPVDPTIKDNRDSKGRLFNGVTPEDFQGIFERVGFRMISRWDDTDGLGRKHRRWAAMLFVLKL